jgi:hypothetical protein
MPRLQTYSAKLEPGDISGGRRATAEDFGAVDLSGVRAVQSAASKFLETKEEDESRGVLVKQAEIRAKYAKRLDDAALTNEDLGKVKEDLDNELSSVTEGLQTKRGFETAAIHGANTTAVFDNQANNILVSRAQAVAKVEGSKFINSLSAQISRDPTTLALGEASVDAFMQTLPKHISDGDKAVMANVWKQGLNVAAAKSLARTDPDGTIALVKGGSFNLSAEARDNVIAEAEREKRMQRQDDLLKKAEAKEKLHNELLLVESEHFDQIKAGKGSWATIRDDPRLAGPEGTRVKQHLETAMRVQAAEARARAGEGGARKSDENVRMQLMLRALAPDGDPNKIYNTDAVYAALKDQADGKRGINTNDALNLFAIIGNQKDENNKNIGSHLGRMMTEFERSLKSNYEIKAKASIDPDLVPRIVNEYAGQVATRMADLRKINENPASVFDKTSKNYMGPGETTQEIVTRNLAASVPSVANPSNQPVTFPDGIERKYKGSGAVTDMNNWAPTKPAAAPALSTSDFQAWVRATGGVLKGNQTQAEAIAEWKKAK